MHQELNLKLPELDWIRLLKNEVEKGKSISALSRECGIKRSSLSMLISGTYPARSLDLVTRKHGARVLKLYRNEVPCPHLNKGISAEACQEFAARPMSTSNPDKLRHWSACQICPHNLKKGAGNA